MSGDFFNDPEGRPVPSVDEPKAGGMKIGRVIVIAGVIGVGLYAGLSFFTKKSSTDVTTDATSSLPLIHAQATPSKVAPEQPGGMTVPNQDKLIYDKVAGIQSQTPEQLLPPPDTPMPRPTPTVQQAEAPQAAVSPPQTPAPMQQVPAQPPAMVQTPPAQTQPPAPVITQQAPAPAPVVQTPPKPAAQVPAKPVEKPVEKHAEKPEPAKPAPAKPVEPAKSAEPAKQAENAKPKPGTQAALTPPKPPVKASPSGSYMIQMAALRDEDAAKKVWERLQKGNSDLLAGLGPTYEAVSLSSGNFVRLRAGPFASKEAAADLCAKLKQRKQDCNVVH